MKTAILALMFMASIKLVGVVDTKMQLVNHDPVLGESISFSDSLCDVTKGCWFPKVSLLRKQSN